MSRSFVCAVAVSLLCASVAVAAPKKVIRPKGAIKDSYIVVLNDEHRAKVGQIASDLAQRHGGRVRSVVKDAINGFIVSMTENQAEALLQDPRVRIVEQDSMLTLASTQTLNDYMYQLDRIDQRSKPVWGDPRTFTYCQDGTGVTIYVIDTGVAANHNQFRSDVWPHTHRVASGIDLVGTDGTANAPCTNVTLQRYDEAWALNGSHGTAVASLAAGKDFGVAKEAMIVPVRVFDCMGQGSGSRAIEGINWVIYHHAAGTPAVANMSWSQPPDGSWSADQSSLEYAVNNLIDDGVTVVAAAGNGGGSACGSRPGMVPRVITVGGSTRGSDERLIESQLASSEGWCVDVFAPGQYVVAAHMWEDGYPDAAPSNFGVRPSNAYGGTSGTSFSTALVSGASAQYLQTHPTATPVDVSNWIVSTATLNALNPATLAADTPNRLLYTNCQ